MKKKTPGRRDPRNRYGKGKVQLNTTIPAEIDEELRRQAEAAGVSRSAYAGLLIVDGITDPVTITKQRASGKIIHYPSEQRENPTALVAENPGN